MAASAVVLLERLPRLRGRLAAMLQLEDPAPLVGTLMALHDIGKWSLHFQSQRDAATRVAGPRHDIIGLWLWLDRLHKLTPGGRSLRPLALATFGHHQRPVDHTAAPGRLRELFGRDGLSHTETYAAEAVRLLMPQPVTVPVAADLAHASWLLAGISMLADWIGSSQQHFPYEPATCDLPTYWQEVAMPRARTAVEASGVVPVPSAPERSYRELMNDAGWQPTPMQAWAAGVPAVPGLYIIEDATGSGKTEAALMLAHRLIAAGHADGLYIALPTGATSDGMYSRMSKVYRRLFADDRMPSLALAHGGRATNEGWRSSFLDPNSDSYCARWIADDRRLTFLAQCGVGTIDQALLSILPTDCQCVRMAGLAQRVLVLDEVHAYDAYMNQEIVRLLEAQRIWGGSTILLSATLPAETKRRLLAPYGGEADAFSSAYPLVTLQTALGAPVETQISPRKECVRRVPLSFVETPDEGLARAMAAARAGQAVLYIRNTVADALESAQAVPDDVRVALFHGRFAQCDRAVIQSAALVRYGKSGTPADRAGQLLIATQVVEQSLDLDFDLIVTDLAPIDLVIQRAGRLWRHERQRPAGAARELIVVGPEPHASAGKDWLWTALRGSAAVYRDHARMWLTAQVLRQASAINAPEGLRALIEHVYAPDATARIPAGLEDVADDAENRRGAERGIAHARALLLSDGYALTGPWIDPDDIGTRLGTETQVVRLAVMNGNRLVPWALHRGQRDSITRLWSMSECAIPRGIPHHDRIPPGLEQAATLARMDWPQWLVDSRPLAVVADDRAIGPDLIYCATLGMRRRAP